MRSLHEPKPLSRARRLRAWLFDEPEMSARERVRWESRAEWRALEAINRSLPFADPIAACPVDDWLTALGMTLEPWQRRVLASIDRGDRRITLHPLKRRDDRLDAMWYSFVHMNRNIVDPKAPFHGIFPGAGS